MKASQLIIESYVNEAHTNDIQKGLPKHSKDKWNTSKWNGVSLGKDKDGYFCYTHRSRSKSYPTPEDIPKSKVDFVESTG